MTGSQLTFALSTNLWAIIECLPDQLHHPHHTFGQDPKLSSEEIMFFAGLGWMDKLQPITTSHHPDLDHQEIG